MFSLLRRWLQQPSEPTTDPLDPWDEHEHLRAAAREAANRDAASHPEGLFDRDLPFAAQTASQTQTRLERLSATRAERVTAHAGEAQHAADVIADADERLRVIYRALVRAGLDESCQAIDPPPRSLGRRVGRVLHMTPPDPLDALRPLLVEARRIRQVRAAAVERATAARFARTQVEDVSEAVADAEVAFAHELVSTYIATMLHRVAPDALTIADPRTPELLIAMPYWRRE
jgi:hypothetical protein